ncbi:uncharacterized protein LOC120265238 [Dioscorea cayenensis subsp. rotundata]|uniref:Uncharacterized protein LOC120265238 n=1 Tax=Dioscorea cayennensis subsp. rotundata TaxID=55577 RepID=A0AB40BNT4_DIOCR|nr:uncharacterized protein LOC120265238 [Dioscorea cayenensis subsp. rotundata]
MASTLSVRQVNIPWVGFSFSLNHGPFNIKKHALTDTLFVGGGICSRSQVLKLVIVIIDVIYLFDAEGSLLNLPLPECWVVSKFHELIDSIATSYDKFFFGDDGREIYSYFGGILLIGTASEARNALVGRSIPRYLLPEHVTSCLLHISFSAHTDLNIKFQSHISRLDIIDCRIPNCFHLQRLCEKPGPLFTAQKITVLSQLL